MASHLLAALLAPKLLRPGNLQATTVRDSPQSTFPTSPLTVWYRESVRFYGPATVGQSNTQGFYRLWPGPPEFVFFDLRMKCRYLTECRVVKDARSIHKVMRRFLPLVLGSPTSESHMQQWNELTTYLSIYLSIYLSPGSQLVINIYE